VVIYHEPEISIRNALHGLFAINLRAYQVLFVVDAAGECRCLADVVRITEIGCVMLVLGTHGGYLQDVESTYLTVRILGCREEVLGLIGVLGSV